MAVESGARASNTLTGELRSRPLAVLLAGACERGTSGTFTFRHGARFAKLTMRVGKIAVVRTSDPVSYLGGILYELGAIDTQTLNASLVDVARDKRLHGAVLLEQGVITPERLDEALAEQTFRKTTHLFGFPEETQWSFREDVDDLAGARDEERPLIDTWRAIWRGLRDQPAAGHVQRTLAKIDGGIHLREDSNLSRFGLAPEELALCERLQAQPTTLEQLVATSPLAAERTSVLVYLLALSRSIVRIETKPLGPTELGVEGVRARAKRIERAAPHAALGLRPDASPEAARAAYFRLARLWHPDKLPKDLSEVRVECERIYACLGEAHRALTSLSGFRPADDVLGGAAGGSGFPANDSVAPPPQRITMRDVDAALTRGDLVAAETMATSLTSAGNDGPAARAVLAWCVAHAGQSTDHKVLDCASKLLDKVLTGDPDCVRAIFFRAELSKRLGRVDAAMRDYRKVVRLDPRHVEAQREVRLYDIRRRAGSSDHAATRLPSTGAAATPEPDRARGAAAPDDDGSVRSGLRRLLARAAGK